MSLVEKMLQELKVEMDTFVTNHTRDDKYFQKQKEFILSCQNIMNNTQGSLAKREQLLNLFNQSFRVLSAAGVWKLCGRLAKIVQKYPKDSLYIDEISQLSLKVTDMAGRMLQMNQELIAAKLQRNTFSVDELIVHLQQAAERDPRFLDQTVVQLTQKITDQQKTLEGQTSQIQEYQQRLGERDEFIAELQNELASLTIKNEKLFQHSQKLLMSQMVSQPERLENPRPGATAFFA